MRVGGEVGLSFRLVRRTARGHVDLWFSRGGGAGRVRSWLSLLAVTCVTSLGDRPVAAGRLRGTVSPTRGAEHANLAAGCLETSAWHVLMDDAQQTSDRRTAPEHRHAVELSQQAQRGRPA